MSPTGVFLQTELSLEFARRPWQLALTSADVCFIFKILIFWWLGHLARGIEIVLHLYPRRLHVAIECASACIFPLDAKGLRCFVIMVISLLHELSAKLEGPAPEFLEVYPALSQVSHVAITHHWH